MLLPLVSVPCGPWPRCQCRARYLVVDGTDVRGRRGRGSGRRGLAGL